MSPKVFNAVDDSVDSTESTGDIIRALGAVLS
jgi:hypothetical protein